MKEKSKINYLREDIIQIHDFINDEIRSEALEAEKQVKFREEDNYAGRSSELPDRVNTVIMDRLKELDFNFTKLQHGRIRVANHNDVNSFHSLIHTDHICKWVLVIYVENSLFLDSKQSGTLFWESNVTKKRRINLKVPKDVVLHSLVVERDTADLTKWTQWLSCPFIENSALLFDSLYFHSPPSPLFEKKSPGKRITLDLFLD